MRCTAQACGLRDAWGDLGARAKIFGVSIDSPQSHEKFIKKYDLPFPLLSDPDKEIVKEPVYDVKALDKSVTRVAREIRLLEQALKATNAKTVVEAYDQDDAALGELT